MEVLHRVRDAARRTFGTNAQPTQDPQTREARSSAAVSAGSNPVFTRLWKQVANGGFDRQVERARNRHGGRAIKFRSEFHKALVVETDRRPGFEVRLCGFPVTEGLVSQDGVVAFKKPVQTDSLEALIGAIDLWVRAYEALYGPAADHDAVAPNSPVHRMSEDDHGTPDANASTGGSEPTERRNEGDTI